jgi:hypothetical protein
MSRDKTGDFVLLRLKARQRERRMSPAVHDRLSQFEALARAENWDAQALRRLIDAPYRGSPDLQCYLCSFEFEKTFLGTVVHRLNCPVCMQQVCGKCSVRGAVLAIHGGQAPPYPVISACVSCFKWVRRLNARYARWSQCASSSKTLADYHREIADRLTSASQKLANFEGLAMMLQADPSLDHAMRPMVDETESSARREVESLQSVASKLRAVMCPPTPHQDIAIRDNMGRYVQECLGALKLKLGLAAQMVSIELCRSSFSGYEKTKALSRKFKP